MTLRQFHSLVGVAPIVWMIAISLNAQGQGVPSTLSLNSNFTNNFSGVSLAGAVDLSANISAGSGQISQIAFAPGINEQAYVSTFENGIWRYDYDPTSTNFLSNGVQVVEDSTLEVIPPPSSDPRLGTGEPNGSLGIAFHDDPSLGTVMYVAPAVAFSGGTANSLSLVQTQRIVRLTDTGGNGVFGDQANDVNQVIVDNVWVNEHHQINQLQVEGDSLFVATGSRTSFGGLNSDGVTFENPGENAYTGAVNFIEDLTAITDQTTTNISGFNIPDFNSDSVIDDLDAKVDSQPFSSNDPSKLRVFSTGMRNIYGIAHDSEGDLWISMNEENSDGPDSLIESQFKNDHLFPKLNELVGDWKVDGDHLSDPGDPNHLTSDPSAVALANGYFSSFVEEFVVSNQSRSSFGGLDFFGQDTEDESLRGDILVTQSFDDQVLVMFDHVTGDQTTVLDGSTSDRILEIQRDHLGNFLVAGQNGRISLLLVDSNVVFGDLDGDGEVLVSDWVIFRTNLDTDISGLTLEDAAMLGDLDGDLDIDVNDFGLFKTAFENVNGAGSLSAAIAVPEPSCAGLAILASVMLVLHKRSSCAASHLHFRA